MIHHHIPFTVWAVVTVALVALVTLAFLDRVIRARHLLRLAVCLVVGAAVAFGVTAWADGQRHAALAAGARGHGHPVSVDGQLAAAFAVITIAVAAVAYVIAALAARRRRRAFAQYRQYPQYGAPGRGRRYSPTGRGW